MDSPRLQDLRRRVQKDPASFAFAQLAEELRRAGLLDEAVDTCRAGLLHHPDYASARVTLGRALLDRGDLDAAFDELAAVLDAAPENLAALKGLADVHTRRGEWHEALGRYRAALALAPQDVDAGDAVAELEARLVADTPETAPAAPLPAPGFAIAPDHAPVRARLERWLEAIHADRARREAR